MKVIKDYEDNWNIILDEKVIGRIEYRRGYSSSRSGSKALYIGEKRICNVKNQSEALEKLNKFFIENKEQIKKIEKLIEELTFGITQVHHQICIDALKKERDKWEAYLDDLKSYDLI